ncbi:Gustatory receptor 88 [Frankliniella occidentalis]|nr:Gustatory receptor 88 [Frankliniella occidentalis]
MHCSARRLTILLWKLLSYPAMLLGVLPVYGWPCHPRWESFENAFIFEFLIVSSSLLTRVCLVNSPFGCSIAQIIAVLSFILLEVPYHALDLVHRIVSFLTFESLVMMCLRGAERLWVVQKRAKMCSLARCIAIYCTKHPPSEEAWRSLLITTLTPLLLVVLKTVLVFSLVLDPIKQSSLLEPYSYGAVMIVYCMYTNLIYWVFVCTLAFVGQLAADLRKDGTVVLDSHLNYGELIPRLQDTEGHYLDMKHRTPSQMSREHISRTPSSAGSGGGSQTGLRSEDRSEEKEDRSEEKEDRSEEKEEEARTMTQTWCGVIACTDEDIQDAWLRIRIRQQILFDLHQVEAGTVFGYQMLVYVLVIIVQSALRCSHSLRAAITSANPSWLDMVKAGESAVNTLYFVYYCAVLQRVKSEFIRMCADMQARLTTSVRAGRAKHEVQRLLGQIRDQGKMGDVLGLFYVDGCLMKSVIGAIGTYVFVLNQFGITVE